MLSSLKRSIAQNPIVWRMIWTAQERMFDLKHSVQTAGFEYFPKLHLKGSSDPDDCLHYHGVQPRGGRLLLQSLPITDHSDYTFIDIGSGKGRMLLLAAEYPFRKIIGVEFATELHQIASRNLKTYRNPKQKCFDITSVNEDALQFPLPNEKLVLYFFFPLRRPLMMQMVERIDQSIEANPRDVIIALMNPEISDVIETMRTVKQVSANQYWHVYRSTTPSRG
jgi:SAM-dependent methyltransferase